MGILIKELLFTFVRYGLVTLFGWFVAHGILTADLAARASSSEVVSAIVAAIGVVALGLYKTYRSRIKLLAALEAAGLSEQDLHTQIKINPPQLIVPFLIGAAMIPFYASTMQACATADWRPRVVAAYQTTETTLGAVQDAEMTAYKSGLVPALDRPRHDQFRAVLSKAFAAQIVFGDGLLVARRGMPPQGYSEWLAAVESTLDELEPLLPVNGPIKSSTLAWARTVVTTIRSLGLSVPSSIDAAAKGAQ